MTDALQLLKILEGVLMSASGPMTIEQLRNVFDEAERPSKQDVSESLIQLAEVYQGRAVELRYVASGYRFQVKSDYSKWINNLWQERPPKYSRATLETLALIAYRQ